MNGVGNRKNALLLKAIHDDGVKVFEDARTYLEAARDAGLKRVVVSSSANTKDVLHVTGLEQLVEGRVDGVTIKEKGLHGKPAPDSFLEGARLAGVEPGQAAVFEDALSGVQAGRDGDFGYVVGVNRLDEAHASGLTQARRLRCRRPADGAAVSRCLQERPRMSSGYGREGEGR